MNFHERLFRARTAPTATLAVRNLSAGYGRRDVVQDVTLDPVKPGEIVALVGPNAAGKSTLLKALAGLVGAKGEALFSGRNLLSSSLADRASHIGFMPQSLPKGVALSVFESVVSAVKAAPVEGRSIAFREARERAVDAICRVGLEEIALKPLDALSGGQRQLASFAQAIVREAAILLLDEPTSALDLRHQMKVMSLCRRMAGEGRVVIIVLHDLTLAAQWADRLVILAQGRVHSQGTPHTVLTEEMLAGVYGVTARVEACSRGFLQIVVDGALDEASAASAPSRCGTLSR